MHNIITTENILLIGALLLFVAVMAGKAAYRFGAPALLFFLGVGMLFGINFISFHSVEATQFVGMIALCIILFTGGMDTKFSEIRLIFLHLIFCKKTYVLFIFHVLYFSLMIFMHPYIIADA